VAALTRRAGVTLAVDNTFLTPSLQRPLELGADVSLYSTTKHIEGHNATVGGAVTSRDEALLERLRFVRKSVGSIQSPFDAWLTLRGIKTLPLRLRQHSQNALAVAGWLEAHPDVRQVLYPGLPSFPQHELALRQHAGHGGVLAFEVEGGARTGVALMNALRLCSLAESLGAVETLVTHPASMTHGDVPPDQRLRTGVSDGLVRLSVGLEDPEDVMADLEQALDVAVHGLDRAQAEEEPCRAAR
jgi:cystathionine beta-lyase/cystathionine gamma-synthase